MTDEELNISLTTEARFSLAKARDKHPSNSDSKLVSEALERFWPTDGSEYDDEELSSVGARSRGRYDGPESEELTNAEKREAKRRQDELSML